MLPTPGFDCGLIKTLKVQSLTEQKAQQNLTLQGSLMHLCHSDCSTDTNIKLLQSCYP